MVVWKSMKQNAWDVIVKREEGGHIYTSVMDTVFFNESCGARYVYLSLVEHDGYPSEIIVRNSNLHDELCGRDIYDYAYDENCDVDWLKAKYVYPYDADI